MTVKQILDGKGREVFTMGAGATLRDAARELASRRIGALVVADVNDGIAGILSERDIVRVVGTTGHAGLDQTVGEVMTANVTTCDEATGIDAVMEIMTRGRFRHLPVAENGRLVGLVSIGDVVKMRIEAAEREAEDMRTYIAAGG